MSKVNRKDDNANLKQVYLKDCVGLQKKLMRNYQKAFKFMTKRFLEIGLNNNVKEEI